jgi:hypothetical protein
LKCGILELLVFMCGILAILSNQKPTHTLSKMGVFSYAKIWTRKKKLKARPELCRFTNPTAYVHYRMTELNIADPRIGHSMGVHG